MPENNIECMKGIMRENNSEDKYFPEERKKRKALGHPTNGRSPEREIHEIHCMA